ncbi:thiamine biosynthesis protein ThiS [Peptoclostridium litorale DSM 5388]|uniref:Thiamine biosynthesis protein ThiS n=1 Tax=Peptoclostridium litorale DSM 5388 TaxID=1121324 RepID=A0A069RG00_PEPLI|nr:sulfur carrier protein ThiS [Peptoclostridium litorale]KDR95951.1 hypothetical protein CLIT_8c01200 [Peptoclostridium litorale DSM 5388]SIO09359.1 thiamine biosynthesis protein ThiS [Peptoclostridium litorale DSM 5388]
MEIILNGEKKQLEGNITVTGLLGSLGMNRCVAVFINGRQLLMAEYETTHINEFDKVRIFRPLSGG